MTRKIFVFGVTGNQGRSTAEALIKGGGYEVYGLTRNKESKSAKELALLGINLVQGDLDDPASYESALAGMDGAFLNVDFWAHYKGDNPHEARDAEIRLAKAAVDALHRAKVGHVVYSTLESLKPRFELPHFDSKGHVTTYIKSIDLPATNLFTSAYYSNILYSHFNAPNSKTGDTYVIPFINSDETRVPGYAVEQTGLWVKAALDNPDKWIRKDMYACGDKPKTAEMAAIIGEVTGLKVETAHRTPHWVEGKEARALVSEELWLNQLAFEKGLVVRDVQKSREIVPEQWDFRAWAQRNADALKKKFEEA
ncbi:hypothetical protein Q5752_000967 [Cryptotrichosporon argae]